MQSTNIDLVSGEWAHLMLTIDKTTGNVCFYKNGVKIEDHTGVTLDYNSDILKESLILGNSLMSGNTYEGFMDDFTIFDTALTENNVQDVYNSYNIDSTPKIPLNEWTHIAANYDSNKKEVDLYINGSNIGKYENYNTTITNNNNDLLFGQGYTGELAEVLVHERPISKGEIKYLYENTNRHLSNSKIFEASLQTLSSTTLLNSVDTGDASLQNTAQYAKGYKTNTKGLICDGTQYATFNDNRNYNSMTFNLRFEHDNSRVAKLIKKENVFECNVDTDGKLKFVLTNSQGVSTTHTTSSAIITTNELTNLSITIDKYDNNIKVYKDNTLTETVSPVTIDLVVNSNNIVFFEGIVGIVYEMELFSGYRDTIGFELTNGQTINVGNYSFDESSGIICKDESMLENNGSIVNNATRMYGTYDPQSKGIQLDQSKNQYVHVDGTVQGNIDFNTMTLSAWVSPQEVTDSTEKQSIITKSGLFSFDLNPTGNLEFNVGSDTYTSTSVIPKSSLEFVPWTHVAVTLDEYSETVKFYKNGEETDSVSLTTLTNIPLSTSTMAIGYNFHGALDNVMIHKGIANVQTELYMIPDRYTPVKIDEDTWTHVAAVYNKETNMVSMYQNGEYVGGYEDYLKDFKTIGSNSNNMFIATTGDNKTFYDGIMDDVRVYSRALHSDEIKELYGNKKEISEMFDRTTIKPVFKMNGDTPEIDVGTVSLTISGLEPYILKVQQSNGTIAPSLQENDTAVQLNWSSWYTMTFNNVIIETTELGKQYEFEYKEKNNLTSRYMVLGLSKTSTPGTGWSDEGSSNSARLLLNWNATISRHDGKNNTYTTFENGSTRCEFWRFTVIEHMDKTNTSMFRDILYEGFTSADRTPSTRTIWGYASRMYHSESDYSKGESFMKNNSKFYLSIGGHNGGTGYFRNFKEIKSLDVFSFALESDRLQGQEDILFFKNNLDKIPSSGYYLNSNITNNTKIKLNSVISTSLTSLADVSLKSYVYVYVVGIMNDGSVDYIKKKVNRTYPPITMSLETVLDDSTNRINVVSGTAISVKQYFILAFVGQPEFNTVKTFVKQSIYNLALSASTGGSYLSVGDHNNQVYTFKTDGIIPTSSSHVIDTTVYLSKAFVTTDINAQPININPDNVFSTYIVGIDMYGNTVTEDKYYDNKITYDNKNTFFTYSSNINLASYGTYVLRGNFLFTYTGNTIKVFKQEYTNFTEEMSITVPQSVVTVSGVLDLPYVVYAYKADGYTQFKMFTVDYESNTVTEATDNAMTTGEEIYEKFVMNEDFLIFKSTTHNVCVYQFDKTNLTMTFLESFNTFTYNGTEYTIDSNYQLSTSSNHSILSTNNVFVMRNGNSQYDAYIFEYNGVSWNNVRQILDVIHTNGTTRYYSVNKSVISYDGMYLFFAGHYSGKGTVLVYRWNGTEYIQKGVIQEGSGYDHFGLDGMSITRDGRFYALDYASRDNTSSGNWRGYTYGYNFTNEAFDFDSGVEVYRSEDWGSGNYYALFNFAIDKDRLFLEQTSASNRFSTFVDIRKDYKNPYESRPYPPRSWTNRPNYVRTNATITSPTGITVTNAGHGATHTSSWTLPEEYVSYGAGEYVAKTNRSYNNSGHFPAGSFLKINKGSPCFHTDNFSPSEASPFIATLIMPVAIKLTRYDIHCRNPASTKQGPENWRLEASNDEFATETVVLDTQSGQYITGGTFKSYFVEGTTTYYNSYRIVVTKRDGSDHIVLGELEFWGCEELEGSNEYSTRFSTTIGTTIEPTDRKVEFATSEATTNITLESGSITIGTFKPVTGFSMVVFKEDQSESDLMTFYNQYVKDITTSNESVYVNNTTYLPSVNDVDMTTLGITFSKIYADLSGTLEDVTEGEYHVGYVFVRNGDDVEVVRSNNIPVYETRQFAYTGLENVPGPTGSTTHPLNSDDGFSGGADKIVISTNDMYMVKRYTTQSSQSIPGAFVVWKNTAIDSIEPLFEYYTTVFIPNDAGTENEGVTTDYQGTLNDIHISHDGTYILATSSKWAYIYKHNEETSTYDIYDSFASRFDQIINYTQKTDRNKWSLADRSALSANGKYIALVGNPGWNSVDNKISCSIWENTGTGFELIQNDGFRGVPSTTIYNGGCSFSGDGKIFVLGSYKYFTYYEAYVGFRGYKLNSSTGKFEEYQYVNYTTHSNRTYVETEENSNHDFIAQTGGGTTIGETIPNSGYWFQGTLNKIQISYDGNWLLMNGPRHAYNDHGSPQYHALLALFKRDPTNDHFMYHTNFTRSHENTYSLSYQSGRSSSANAAPTSWGQYANLSADGTYVVTSCSGFEQRLVLFRRNDDETYTKTYDYNSGGDRGATNVFGFWGFGMCMYSPSGKYLFVGSSSSQNTIYTSTYPYLPSSPSGVSGAVPLTTNLNIFNNRTYKITSIIDPEFESNGYYYYKTANESWITPTMNFILPTRVFVITQIDMTASDSNWQLYGDGSSVLGGEDLMNDYSGAKTYYRDFPSGSSQSFGVELYKWGMIIKQN